MEFSNVSNILPHSSQGSTFFPVLNSSLSSSSSLLPPKRRWSISFQSKMENCPDSRADIVSCTCGKSDSDEFMIQCDGCECWYHGVCMLINEEQVKDIERYHCPRCRHELGPLTLCNRPRFWEKPPPVDSAENIPTRNGSRQFVQYLEKRKFDDPSGIPVLQPEGHEVLAEYLEQNCFACPILINSKEGLDITIPEPGTMHIEDIEEMIGSMKELDVIDVAEQRERKMLMREWVDYFNTPSVERKMRLNLISLEFSSTRLAPYVDPPAVVKAVSWVDNHWPDMHKVHANNEAVFVRPEVQKYCLMSVGGSYTDFHIDFGGTSVWYHVLQGEKIFYLIRPTEKNLKSFEQWYQSDDQAEKFLPNLIDDACYRCVIRQGQTVFLPSGWIHAVLTPVDSIVFGGNFLHSYNIEMQLRVYALERRTKTPEKYFFPNFETLHWYVAEKIKDLLLKYRMAARADARLMLGKSSKCNSLNSSTSHSTESSRDATSESSCPDSGENSADEELHSKKTKNKFRVEDMQNVVTERLDKSLQGSSWEIKEGMSSSNNDGEHSMVGKISSPNKCTKRGSISAPEYLVRGARVLVDALQAWVRIRSQEEQQTIPDSIKSRRLISDLDKLVSYWEEELWGLTDSNASRTEEATSAGRRRKKLGGEEWASKAGYNLDMQQTSSGGAIVKKKRKLKSGFIL